MQCSRIHRKVVAVVVLLWVSLLPADRLGSTGRTQGRLIRDDRYSIIMVNVLYIGPRAEAR